jgi:hypothetical protein
MSSATANIITLLALYFAALILAVQHVSDRFSPSLSVPVLVRHASVPFIVLIILTAIAVLLPIEGRRAGAIVLVAILVSLCGSYYLWSRLGDGELIAGLLHKMPGYRKEAAVRDVLWNAVQSSNPRVAAVALRVFSAGTPEQDRLLQWLIEHREIVAKEWMTRELVDVILPLGVAGQPSEESTRALEILFVDALDREDYDRALLVLDAVMDGLTRADHWTQAHAHLLHAFGFALWNVGQLGESVVRRASIPPRLESIQSLLHSRLKRLWIHLRELGDPEAVELYAQVIGDLTAHTGDDFMLTRLYEAMEAGFREGLWTEQALHQLAVDLRSSRQEHMPESGAPGFELERIDSMAITGAAMLVELYGGTELERYLGNAMLFKDSLRHVREQPWLKPESYASVKRALSQRH